MIKVIKNNSKVIIAFVLGMLISGISVSAVTLSFASGDVEHTKSDGTKTNVSAALNDLYSKASAGNAIASNILSGKTALSGGTLLTGTMANQGAKIASLNTGTTSYTIPAGYHNGSGKVSITTQEKTVTSSRTAQTVTPDSGKVLSKVTVNALAPTGTYTPTTRGASIDMGATSNYRYVNTNSVPNTNSGTYTFAANSTGGTVDLGATNTYRYVNATNVYNKGKADAEASCGSTITISVSAHAYVGGDYTQINGSVYVNGKNVGNFGHEKDGHGDIDDGTTITIDTSKYK